jgi:hypothetical protein
MENLTIFLQKLVKYGVMVEEYSFHNKAAAMVNFKVAMGSI